MTSPKPDWYTVLTHLGTIDTIHEPTDELNQAALGALLQLGSKVLMDGHVRGHGEGDAPIMDGEPRIYHIVPDDVRRGWGQIMSVTQFQALVHAVAASGEGEIKMWRRPDFHPNDGKRGAPYLASYDDKRNTRPFDWDDIVTITPDNVDKAVAVVMGHLVPLSPEEREVRARVVEQARRDALSRRTRDAFTVATEHVNPQPTFGGPGFSEKGPDDPHLAPS